MKPETVNMLNSIVPTCFFGTWIVLGIGGFFLFYLGRDVAFKRKWFPWFVVLGGVLFVFFSTTLSVLSSQSFKELRVLIVVVPMVGLISWMNIKFTKFCDQCGATIYNGNWFSPMKFCPKCGSLLDAKPKILDDLLD